MNPPTICFVCQIGHNSKRVAAADAATLLGVPIIKRRLAHRTSAHEVDDGQQDHRSDQGHEEAGQRQTGIVDRTTRQNQAADKRADDADDDVQEDTLLCVGPHDDAGKPAHNAAHDQPQDNAHDVLRTKLHHALTEVAGACRENTGWAHRFRHDH